MSLNVPAFEYDFPNSNALMLYQVNVDTLKHAEEIFKKFKAWPVLDNLSILDNGTLVIIEDRFGGKAVCIKYINALAFCCQIIESYEAMINKKEDTTSFFAISSDDFHSGWNWDYLIRLQIGEKMVNLQYEFDYTVEMTFDRKYFLHNFFKLCNDSFSLFQIIYPDLRQLDIFKTIEYYCMGHNLLKQFFETSDR